MTSTGIAAAKSSMRSISALFLGAVEEPVDEAHDAVLHAGDGARIEGAGEEAPDARVQRRVVEDEARRVMLVERRRAVFGAELDGLVRAEDLRVLVDALDVGVARDQDLPGIEAVDRIVLAQRRIIGVGVVVEAGRQALEAEAPRHRGGRSVAVGLARSLRRHA